MARTRARRRRAAARTVKVKPEQLSPDVKPPVNAEAMVTAANDIIDYWIKNGFNNDCGVGRRLLETLAKSLRREIPKEISVYAKVQVLVPAGTTPSRNNYRMQLVDKAGKVIKDNLPVDSAY